MPTTNPLRDIRTFPALVRYLESELEWPIEAGSFDDLTFEYVPAELGLKDADAVKIKKIHQLRPLATGQPWGIFFVEFEKKKLPVVVLRCILSHLVVKKRQSANKSDQAVWNPEDLLFISAFGDETTSQREIAFAHFHQEPGDLPTLRVLGWDGDDTPLKLDYVASQLSEKLHWPANPKDQNAWRAQWRAPFRHRLGHVIRTSDHLAEVLAALARGIRDRCKIKMRAESEHGPLTKLYKGFQTALIHDLKPNDFADTYAQTITYGLLTAAISRTEMSEGPHGTVLYAENVTDMVPVTNPFLKEMLQTFLKVGGRKDSIDFDELGIQDVVELLRGEETDLPAILRDFGNKTRGEDPVIHFYEHFLSAYNKQLKIQRGVFYTPQPVVSYIVRSVHELLQTEFGLEDGLASTVTWGEMVKISGSSRGNEAQISSGKGQSEPPHVGCYELKIPEGVKPEEMFVQILDPATGTATFLVEAIDVIHRTLKAKWEKGGIKVMPKLPPTSFPRQPAAFGEYWNQYVPLALLPRLHGYELMMAPYAIAHMKIGLKLHETGYHFGTEERARIYLTNALEPAEKEPKFIPFEALAHEASAVNEIKWYKRFTVVIGNPPYSGISSNMTEAAQRLVDRYRLVNGEPLGERKVWLQNDYVKFLGFAHKALLATGVGCMGYITDNSYLDGPTFRGVRSNFLNNFNKINILNLHGSSKKLNTAADAGDDQNVFDITQAVAVLHGVITAKKGHSYCRSADLLGTRQSKYERLVKLGIGNVNWSNLEPTAIFFQFVETNRNGETEYNSYYSIKAAFPIQSVGIQTSRDDLAIDFTREELVTKVHNFASPKLTDSEIRNHYFPGKKVGDYLAGDTRSWSLSKARKELSKLKNLGGEIVGIHYRPFDFRFIFNSTLLVDWPRPEVSDQMCSGKNVGLCLLRRTENARDYDYFSVSRNTISNHQVSLKDGTYLLPLYVYPSSNRQGLFSDEQSPRPNFSGGFVKAIADALGVPQDRPHGVPKGLAPEDIFNYAYAVFHSPAYRSRYAVFLKMDSPRLPLTGNMELFRALARLGGELVSLHLLESPKLEKPITEYIGGRGPEVEKISWSENTVWLDKALTIGFRGVREEVWNFHIGGYQVCEKWLKDRKGRTLSAEDRTHYQKIVVALSETIRLMAEIDKVIDQHGGWPLK